MTDGDIDRQLAQAAATISDLRAQLADANQRAGDAERLRITLAGAQQETQAVRAALIPLQARVDELERLLAPPPDGRGIRYGMYYRATDASKHKVLPDVLRRQDILDLIGEGETEATATRLISQGWRRQKDGG